MSNQEGERVDFADPTKAALVLHQYGVGLLTKAKSGDEINGDDIAEGLAYLLLTLAGQARNAAQQQAQQQESGRLVQPAVFAR